MSSKKAYILQIVSMLIFGSNGLVASGIELSSWQIVFFRTSLGFLTLFILLFATKGERHAAEYPKELLFSFLAGLCTGISWILLFEGYDRIGVGISTLLFDTAPIIVMILSPLLFNEKLTSIKLLGFAAVVLGVVFLNGRIVSEGGDVLGVVLGLLSAVAYATLIILSKKAVHLGGMEKTAVQLLGAFIAVAVFMGLFRGGYHMEISSGSWIWIVVIGVINTGLACYMYFSSISYLPAQTVSVLSYIEPLAAVLLGVVVLGEQLSFLQWVGAALIIGGAVFSECFHRKSEHSPEISS